MDPNTYALTVQLDIEDSKAFRSLDNLSAAMTDLEDKVSSAAKNALASLESVASNLEASLGKAVEHANTIDDAAIKIGKDFNKVSKIFLTIDTTNEKLVEKFDEIRDYLDERLRIEKKLEKLSIDQQKRADLFVKTIEKTIATIGLKNVGHQQQLDLLNQEAEAAQRGANNIGRQRDAGDQTTASFSRLVNAIRSAVNYLMGFTDLQEQFVTLNNRLYGSMEELASRVRKLASGYGILEKEALEAMKALIDVRTPEDSLDRLALTVGKLTRLTGVSATGLAEYTKRMRGVGLDAAGTEEHLAQLADMQRKYGVSVEQMRKSLGDTSVSLTAMETLFDDGGKGFDRLRVQMRGIAESYGATGDAAASVMTKMANSYVYQQMVASETGMQNIQTVEDYGKAMAGLGDNIDEIIRQEMAAGATRSEALFNAQVYGERVMKLSAQEIDAVRKIAKARKDAAAAGKDVDWAAISADAQKQMDEQLTDTQRFSREVRLLGSEFRQVIGPIVELIAIAILPLIKALRWLVGWIGWAVTGIKTFLDWLARISPIGGGILRWVVALGVAFLAFKVIIPAIGSLLGGLFSWIGSFIPAFVGWMGSLVTAFVSALTSVIGAIGTAFRTVMTAIADGLRTLLGAVSGNVGPLLALGLALIMVAVAAWIFAQAIVAIKDVGIEAIPVIVVFCLAIAAALWGLVASVTALAPFAAVAVGILLAIGVAMILIAISAWIFAQALVTVAGIGSTAADSLFILAAGIMIMAFAICVLIPAIMMAGATYPILLALGAVFLAIGLAVLLMGIGLKLAVDSLTNYEKALRGVHGAATDPGSPPLYIALAIIAAGLIMVGIAGFAALPGVIVIGIALVVLAVAAVIAAYAIQIIYGILQNIDVGYLVAFGEGIFSAAWCIFEASAVALAAGVMLILAGPLLVLGAASLLTASGILILAAPILYVGAMILAAASGMLDLAGAALVVTGDILGAVAPIILSASTDLFTSSVMLLAAGGFFIASAALILLGAAALAGTTFALILASIALGIGVAWIAGVAAELFIAGAIMYIGGLALYAGIMFISRAVDEMSALAVPMMSGSWLLFLSITKYLWPAAKAMIVVGPLFLVGALLFLASISVLTLAGMAMYAVGLILIGSGALFVAGMFLLRSGINLLIEVIEPFKKAVTDLLAVTGELLPAAGAILLAGLYVIVGATLLGTGSAILAASVAALALVAAGMWLASIVIKKGATKLEAATEPLFNAGKYVYGAAWLVSSGFDKISQSINNISNAATNTIAGIGDNFRAAVDSFKEPASDLLQTLSSITLAVATLGIAMQAPVDQLTVVMDQMASVLTGFGPIGEKLETDLGNLITTVDSYAARLEGVSERIQTAVATKAIPAMRAAEEAGIEEAIKAESISTIELIPPEKDDNAEKTNELLQRQIDILDRLADGVEKIGAGSGTEVAQILEMLQTFLPGIVAKEEGLSTQMNDWMR